MVLLDVGSISMHRLLPAIAWLFEVCVSALTERPLQDNVVPAAKVLAADKWTVLAAGLVSLLRARM